VLQATKKAVMLGGDDGDWLWAPRSVIEGGDGFERGEQRDVWAKQWWVEKEQLIFEETDDEGSDEGVCQGRYFNTR